MRGDTPVSEPQHTILMLQMCSAEAMYLLVLLGLRPRTGRLVTKSATVCMPTAMLIITDGGDDAPIPVYNCGKRSLACSWIAGSFPDPSHVTKRIGGALGDIVR